MDSLRSNDPVPGDPTAVFGRRCGAYIIDLVILFVVAVIAISSLATLEEVASPDEAARICAAYEGLNNDDLCVNSESTVFVLEADKFGQVMIWLIVIAAVNLVVIASITGGSLGKLAVGIRVVDQSTFQKAGFLKHLLRWVLFIVDGFPYFVPITGLIVGLVSKGHRRVGDFAAKTLVVKKSDVGMPKLVPGVNDGAVSVAPLPGYWDPPAQPPATQPPPAEPVATAPVTPPTTDPGTSGDFEQRDDHEPDPASGPEVAGADQASQPGVDAPMWDEARDTYIQWDPQLEAWMEWSESAGRWIPISQ